jgi:hypothetical protein
MYRVLFIHYLKYYNYMKNLFFALLIGLVSMSIAGCEKYPDMEGHASLGDVVSTKLYLGVETVASSEYGAYLSFDDPAAFEAVIDTLKGTTAEDRDAWAQAIEFTSLDRTQRLMDEVEDPSMLEMYPNEAFASVLNPDGYMMVDGILYQDTDNGNLVYKIDADGNRTIHYEQGAQNESARAQCLYDDDDDAVAAHRCASIGMDTYKISAHLDHWTNWILWDEYLYVRSSHMIGNCNNLRWVRAFGTLSFTGSYDLTIDGNPVSGQLNNSYGNLYSVRHQIAYGQNICMNSVTAHHRGVYAGTGKGATAHTSF